MSAITSKPIISADSHITEPPDLFKGRIAKQYEDTAPKMITAPGGGDVFQIPGIPDLFPITVASAANKRGKALGERKNAKFMDCYHGGWDPVQRLKDQDTDSIAAEVLYPSLGMFLCNHPDPQYKKACMDAYNLWLQEFCDTDRDRLIGLGQTPMLSPEEGIEDLKKIKAQGFRGVMMPGYPMIEDYHSKIYDPFWQAAVDLDLPLSFHILTYKDKLGEARGPKINAFMSIMRGNQDIIGVLIFGGVFERFPKLKVACVEADGGWVPHYMYRMDHAFKHANPDWMAEANLSKYPSEYFRENIYVTFQDDLIAFKVKDLMNTKRMMWANDFPHLDSTWPNSQAMLAEHTGGLTQQERDDLLHNNAAELYHLA